MDLEELFRSRLDNIEMVPSDALKSNLMRKVSTREFFRFSSSRFNVYYLVGVAAVVAAALFILTSRNDNTTGIPEDAGIIAPTRSDSLPVAEPVRIKPVVDIKRNNSGNVIAGKTTIKTENSKIIKPSAASGNVFEIKPDTLINKITLASKASIGENTPLLNNNQVDLKKLISASFIVSESAGCAPMRVKFLNNSISYNLCRWSFGEGGFSEEKNPEWIFDLEGEYKVVLDVSDSEGNHATASTIIVVHPRPSAKFDINPEKPVLPDDEIHFLNYSKNAVKFKWDFGDGTISGAFEPDHRYRRYGTYNVKLVAVSESGCADTMLVKNAFSESGCYIKFPNAFIPGSDGPIGGYYSIKSDESARIFHPITSGVSEYHMKIFSKLGIAIFESNDINIGWDGYNKGQLCEPGVYIWKVRGTYKNGEPFVKMGDVTLLRN